MTSAANGFSLPLSDPAPRSSWHTIFIFWRELHHKGRLFLLSGYSDVGLVSACDELGRVDSDSCPLLEESKSGFAGDAVQAAF
jgi:hypothetical protein